MCRAAGTACSAVKRCSARSTRHRGRAVGRSFFLLDVSGPLFVLDVISGCS
jgi:hypothetical protein